MLAQEPHSHPAFEVASIKPAAQQDGPMGLLAMKQLQEAMQTPLLPIAMWREGRRVTIRGKSLLILMATAYRVKVAEISGPSWMSDQLFDIDAKVPEDQSPALANEMLQTLLADRFGLKLHHETRDVPGYNLVVGKSGPKLTSSAGSDAAPIDDQQQKAKSMMEDLQKKAGASSKGAGSIRRSAHGVTSAELANMVSQMAGSPVIDETGLQGRYDVVLETSPDRPDQPGHSIFEAVDELGLKLVVRKVPVETLVVDQISRTPTEN